MGIFWKMTGVRDFGWQLRTTAKKGYTFSLRIMFLIIRGFYWREDKELSNLSPKNLKEDTDHFAFIL